MSPTASVVAITAPLLIANGRTAGIVAPPDSCGRIADVWARRLAQTASDCVTCRCLPSWNCAVIRSATLPLQHRCRTPSWRGMVGTSAMKVLATGAASCSRSFRKGVFRPLSFLWSGSQPIDSIFGRTVVVPPELGAADVARHAQRTWLGGRPERRIDHSSTIIEVSQVGDGDRAFQSRVRSCSPVRPQPDAGCKILL